MTLAIEMEAPPLRPDADGAVRIGGTRVLLDTVIGAFGQGASAEQIADQYPAVDLAQVYAVIAFYLRHTDQVDAYLADRRQPADRLLRNPVEVRPARDPRAIARASSKRHAQVGSGRARDGRPARPPLPAD